MNNIYKEIITRFIIEPRAQGTRGFSCSKWLIVYDTKTKGYLKQEPYKAYMRFATSTEVFNYCMELIKEEKYD